MWKCAIFDFDGTLFDTMRVWDTAGERFLAQLGICAEADLLQTLKPMSLEQAATYLKAHYALSISPSEIIAGILRVVADFYQTQAMPKPFAREFVSKLHQRGVRLCIATASDETLVKSALERCKMDAYFEAVFSCAQTGRGKEFPDIYRTAISSFGAQKSETLVFEDALFALKTAKNDGFCTVGVFDESESAQAELKEISDFYIKDFSDTQDLLQ